MAMGIGSALSVILSGFFIERVGSANAFRIFMFLAGIAGTCLVFVTNETLSLVCIVVGVLGSGGSFNIMYIVHQERVAGEILGSSLEIILSIAKLCTAVIPAITTMAAPTPMIVLAVAAFSSVVLSLFLATPQVMDADFTLLQTLDQSLMTAFN